MAKKIKCGEYLYKDGIVIKRPGKKFRAPSLPKKLQIQYPNEENCSSNSPAINGRHYDDIGQMNYMREVAFQKKYKELHSRLRKLYYFGRVISGIKKVCYQITRKRLSTEDVIGLMAEKTERQRFD